MTEQTPSRDHAPDPTAFMARLEELLEPAHRLACAMLLDTTAAEQAVLEAALTTWQRGDPVVGFRDRFLGLVLAACRRHRPAAQPGTTGDAERRSLVELGPRERALLCAFFSLRLPIDELARTFGMPARTARARIARTTRRRRGELGDAVTDRPLAETFDVLVPPPAPGLGGRIREAIAAGSPPDRRRYRIAAAPAAAVLLAAAAALAAVLGVHLATAVDHAPRPRMAALPSPPAVPRPTPSATPAQAPTPTPAPSPISTPIAPTVVASGGFVCGAQAGGGTPGGALVAVRTGLHPGYDRFVLQFADQIPPFQISLDGATVQVSLQGAAASATYPTDLRPGYPVLIEALQTHTGSTLQWDLRLSRPACVRVLTLGGPSRLVVDVQDS
jgi:hypothetical protein